MAKVDLKAPKHGFPLPQTEYQKGHGHHQPDGQAAGETLADGNDENGENRQEQELGQVHVGHGVAAGKQTQAKHGQLWKEDGGVRSEAPKTWRSSTCRRHVARTTPAKFPNRRPNRRLPRSCRHRRSPTERPRQSEDRRNIGPRDPSRCPAGTTPSATNPPTCRHHCAACCCPTGGNSCSRHDFMLGRERAFATDDDDYAEFSTRMPSLHLSKVIGSGGTLYTAVRSRVNTFKKIVCRPGPSSLAGTAHRNPACENLLLPSALSGLVAGQSVTGRMLDAVENDRHAAGQLAEPANRRPSRQTAPSAAGRVVEYAPARLSPHLVPAALTGSEGDGNWLLAYNSESANTLYFSFSMAATASMSVFSLLWTEFVVVNVTPHRLGLRTNRADDRLSTNAYRTNCTRPKYKPLRKSLRCRQSPGSRLRRQEIRRQVGICQRVGESAAHSRQSPAE